MGNGNGHGPEAPSLIELGYEEGSKEARVIMIMNGTMDGKPFKAISHLAIPQALKLADDLRMTVITITGMKEKV